MSNLEQQYRDDLEATLDREFPKGDAARGRALVLFAEATLKARKIIKAFGGCEICYGKGYSTQAEVGRAIRYCGCERGRQLERIMDGARL